MRYFIDGNNDLYNTNTLMDMYYDQGHNAIYPSFKQYLNACLVINGGELTEIPAGDIRYIGVATDTDGYAIRIYEAKQAYSNFPADYDDIIAVYVDELENKVIGVTRCDEGEKAMTTINNHTMAAIAALMDDRTRETVHSELAPCTAEEFLKRYTEMDPSFEKVLKNEFGIVLD